MADSFSTVESRSWFSRIGNSLKGIIAGLVMVGIAFPLLFWNEGRAVDRAKTLKAGEGAVVSIAADDTSPEYDGRLVHLTGTATTDETLKDSIFGVVAPESLKLERAVEMYQWQERTEEKTKKKMGGGEEVTTTYYYDKVWSETPINSKRFEQAKGHANPSKKEFESQTQPARDVTVGAYKLTDRLLGRINTFELIPLSEEGIAKLPEALRTRTRLHGDGLFIGSDPATPQIGDLRVVFSRVPATEISLVSKRIGTTFEPWQSKTGSLELLEIGAASAENMFTNAKEANKMLTWVLRLVGLIVMAIGFKLILEPLAVLADVLPFLGTLARAGTGFVSFILAFVLSLTTIGIAWIVYRPLLGGSILALAAGGLYWGWSTGRKKARTLESDSPTMSPPNAPPSAPPPPPSA